MNLLQPIKKCCLMIILSSSIQVAILRLTEASETYTNSDGSDFIYCYPKDVEYEDDQRPNNHTSLSTIKYKLHGLQDYCLQLPTLNDIKKTSKSFYFFQNETIQENPYIPIYCLTMFLQVDTSSLDLASPQVYLHISIENIFKMYIPYMKNNSEIRCSTADIQQHARYKEIYLAYFTETLPPYMIASPQILLILKNLIQNNELDRKVNISSNNKKKATSLFKDFHLNKVFLFGIHRQKVYWLIGYVKNLNVTDYCSESIRKRRSLIKASDIATCNILGVKRPFEFIITESHETWLLLKQAAECCVHVDFTGNYSKSDWSFLKHFLRDNYVCYGNSPSCPAVDHLWIKLDSSNALINKLNTGNLIVMREDIKRSFLVKWLSSFIAYGKFSSELSKYIIELDCKCRDLRFPLCLCFTKESDHDIFIKFIFELRMREVQCDENTNYILCRTLQITEVPFLFIQNCSEVSLTDNKLAHLVLNSISHFIVGNKDYELQDICMSNMELALTYELENIFLKDVEWPLLNANSLLSSQEVERDKYKSHTHDSLCNFITNGNDIRLLLYECDTLQNKSTIVFEHKEEKYDILSFPYDSNIVNNTDINRIGSVRTELKALMGENETKLINSVIESIDSDNIKLTIFEYVRLIMRAKIHNDTKCLHELNEGKFKIIVSNITKKSFVALGPVQGSFFDKKCLVNLFYKLKINSMGEDLYEKFDSKNTTKNIFWPSCLHNMVICWRRDTDVVIDWDYLSESCKLKEYLLIFMSISITFITIMGNVLVLIILIATGLMFKKSFMIYTSLAIADLILGLMSGTLAVYDQFALISGSLTLSELDIYNQYTDSELAKSDQVLGFQQLRIPRQGYPVFCSIVMNISIYSSLLSLAIYSIERFRVFMGHPFPRSQMVGCICFSWLLSIALSITVNLTKSGMFIGYFDPITKLTTNIGSVWSMVSSVVFYLGATIAGVASVVILIMTIAAIVILYCKEKESQRVLRIHHIRREWKMRFMTRTFVYMVLLFLVSCIPLIVDLLLDLSTLNPTAHFVCWWLFMAGASWNWILYCFRGQLFREHASKLLHKIFNNTQTKKM